MSGEVVEDLTARVRSAAARKRADLRERTLRALEKGRATRLANLERERATMNEEPKRKRGRPKGHVPSNKIVVSQVKPEVLYRFGNALREALDLDPLYLGDPCFPKDDPRRKFLEEFEG